MVGITRSKVILFNLFIFWFQSQNQPRNNRLHFPDPRFCSAWHRFWRYCDPVSCGSLPLRKPLMLGRKVGSHNALICWRSIGQMCLRVSCLQVFPKESKRTYPRLRFEPRLTRSPKRTFKSRVHQSSPVSAKMTDEGRPRHCTLGRCQW